MDVICDSCGKTIIGRTPSDIKSVKHHYCDIECRDRNKSIITPCIQCGKQIKRLKSNIGKSGNVYCSQKCAAIINNKKYPKRIKTKKCKHCSALISCSNTYCPDCISKKTHIRGKLYDGAKPLSYYVRKGKGPNTYANVRHHAGKITEKWDKSCMACGYNQYVETCHIKPINSFSQEAPVSEINCPSNLLILCRNCHWEFDHQVLLLENIKDTQKRFIQI